MTQLELFEKPTEEELLRAELKEVRDRCENVRRGLFARHNSLAKMYFQMKEELDVLKSLYFKRFSEDNALAPEIMVKDQKQGESNEENNL